MSQFFSFDRVAFRLSVTCRGLLCVPDFVYALGGREVI
jgi:hypothetical protein